MTRQPNRLRAPPWVSIILRTAIGISFRGRAGAAYVRRSTDIPQTESYMANPHHYGLILAGGRGTRFWPRSRKRSAKQVLNVVGARSLIQNTVDRLRPVIPPERLWVLTNDYLRDEIVRQLPEVPAWQIQAEPAQRNTAPAIGLAAHILQSIDANAVMGVFPADHMISKPAKYLSFVRGAFRSA